MNQIIKSSYALNEWHPATEKAITPHNSTLLVGEKVIETIQSSFGPSFDAEWVVTEHSKASRWIIETDCEKFAARITYQLKALSENETHFQRILEFSAKHFPWNYLNSTFVRGVLILQSKKALENLKRVLLE